MSYLLFAWTATILYGLITVIAKLTNKYSVKNPWLVNFLWALAYIPLLPMLALYFHVGWPKDWLSILTTSLLWFAGGTAYVLVLSVLDVSVLGPFINLRTAFSVLLAALLLGEVLTARQYFLIFLIFLFGFLVNLDEHFSLRSLFKKKMFLALGMVALLSLYGMLVKPTIALNGYWTTFVWTFSLSFLMSLITLPFFHRDLLRIGRREVLIFLLISLLSLIANLANNKALETNVSLSSAIVSLPVSLILAFLLALLAPNLLEKHPLKIYAIRAASAAVMFLAALQLST